MNADLFTAMLVIGIIIACVGVWYIWYSVFDDGIDNDTHRWVIRAVGVVLLAAWIWLPWGVYGLVSLPWSALGRVLPPVDQASVDSKGPVRFNADGTPQGWKKTKNMEIER